MKITAIIVTYNRPDFLALILDSIKQQKMLPHEVIIADDGSTPDTSNLVSKESQIFPVPLKYVWHDDRGFRGAAIRNKAIKESTGDCLLFSDGDLVFHPCFFADFSRNLKPGYALIGSRTFLTRNATNKILGKNSFQKVSFLSRKIEKNRLNAIRVPGVFRLLQNKIFSVRLRGGLLCAWKNDIVSVNGWNEDFEGWGKEDTELVARLSFSGVALKKLKFAGITYHLWHEYLSRSYVPENEKLLTACIVKQRKWCVNGLVKS